MIRFYIALWASKLMYLINKIRKNDKDDFPGLLANKLCPNFLEKINKPKLVITITGTNGKTTTSTLIYNKLKSDGLKVSFNDWGANLSAGHALNLIRCVNIFNKVKYDASVLEADEKTLAITMGAIKPNYILVTNICKDSLRRNAHPEFIYNCINKAFDILGKNTVAILNACDPISANLANNGKTKRIFFEMNDVHENALVNKVKDISVCPLCDSPVTYSYHLYRHIGKYECTNKKCNFKTPEAKYYASSINYEAKTIDVVEEGKKTTYSLISDNIFNAFNVLSCISVLREIGKTQEEIKDFLITQSVPSIRETCKEYNNIKYYAYSTKSQNVSAASTVFEYLSKEPSKKEIVFCLDEVQDDNHPTETLTWIYETDYEFLNNENINKIIVSGHMYLNHKLRLLLAGIPKEKIIAFEDYETSLKYVSKSGIDKVYVLYETDCVSKGQEIRDKIISIAKEGK